MPHWDDEYLIPYLSTGHIGPMDSSRKGPKKKVNIGFQIPGNEFPAKPKPKPRARAKPKPRAKAKPRPATRRTR